MTEENASNHQGHDGQSPSPDPDPPSHSLSSSSPSSSAVSDDQTELHKFLQTTKNDEKNADRLKEILAGLDKDQIHQRSPYDEDKTAMEMAVDQGMLWAVRVLLDYDTSLISRADENGRQPLHKACREGHLEIVNLLLQHGADIEAKESDGSTPFDSACWKGHKDVVELLLSKGANSQGCDNDGWTPIRAATEHKRLDVIEVLLNENPDNINVGDNKGETSLHVASGKGYVAIMHLLLEKGADIDMPDKEGETPLHCASRNGRDETARLLLQKQANVDKTDDKGETPLHAAAREGYRGVISALLEGNPSINMTDNNGKTPLCAASQSAHVECVRRLCEAGADCNIQANEKEGYKTALYYALDPSESGNEISDAVKENQHTIVVELLAHGADPWIRNLNGDTALHHAAKVGYMGAYKAILEVMKDGKRRSINNQGYTALGLALESCPGEIMGLMIDSETANMFDSEDEYEALLWAAMKKQTFHHAEKLFQERKHLRDKTAPEDSSSWSVIEWATYLEMPSVLDMLLDSQAAAVNLKITGISIERDDFLRNLGLKAAVIKCRIQDEKLRFFPEHRNVNDVIYGMEPVGITTTDSVFTWVHLPATNMTWMNDLLKRILIEEPSCLNESQSEEDLATMSKKVPRANAFFESSWSQIPDTTSESRIMKPLYTNEPTLGATSHDHYLRAVYMPYLALSRQHQGCHAGNDASEGKQAQNDGRDQQETRAYDAYHGLLKCYEGDVIHGSATLEESFYGFPQSQAQDQATQQEDQQQKSENQVVAKAIHSEGVAERPCFTLVRVNQLWVWVVGHKLLITATTHPIDQVKDSFLADLCKHIKKRARVRSPHDMAKAVVTYCIDSYDRPPESTVYDTNHSIHQIFSDSINKIAREDANLLEDFCQHMEEGKEIETKTAMRLSAKIRNIHVQLRMLQEIGKHQMRVWKKLMSKSSSDKRRLETHVMSDVEDMIASADRIKSNVEMTLSLVQKEIANQQARERVKQGEIANELANELASESFQQGRTVMISAVITAFCLTSYSLTSLFGVGVDSFGKAPYWAFLLAFVIITALLCFLRLGETHRGAAVGGSTKEEADNSGDKKTKQLETGASFRSDKDDWQMLRNGRVTWRRRQRETTSQV
ncbi:hypothetical protein CEP52_010378 [Fusarium oligoseptatum]|uniref:Uncharacterized protein n=1 Tax=Fusarium oligoseptatum TaxID=2604345 RepID=A0A428T8M1_9HYPO|nr:hypothetical protein CEP52_010378 [Fusarium oligoseptatum]